MDFKCFFVSHRLRFGLIVSWIIFLFINSFIMQKFYLFAELHTIHQEGNHLLIETHFNADAGRIFHDYDDDHILNLIQIDFGLIRYLWTIKVGKRICFEVCTVLFCQLCWYYIGIARRHLNSLKPQIHVWLMVQVHSMSS